MLSRASRLIVPLVTFLEDSGTVSISALAVVTTVSANQKYVKTVLGYNGMLAKFIVKSSRVKSKIDVRDSLFHLHFMVSYY